jgi:PKD repeat protein
MKAQTQKKTILIKSNVVILITLVSSALLIAAVATTLEDFFLPGSQPGESGNLEHPDKCDNCHGGYDQAVEPAFNWRGSMMAQAARDPLYEACLAISNQDAPESGDLCIRCHAPEGWLGGRSTPTDGSTLTNADREGVHCDFCHKLIKPVPLGTNPFPDDPDYTANTLQADQSYLSILAEIPLTSANGMFVVSNDISKRGPYINSDARHRQYYSPFHSESAICGTCHDVSNPAFSKTDEIDEFGSPVYAPNTFGAAAPSFDPNEMFPVERTYAEWLISDFNSLDGIPVPGFGGNKTNVSTCQDCHVRDVTGYGCNKIGAPLRDDLPLHDMTGGNTFIPGLVAQLFPGDVDAASLDAGVQRASEMLHNASEMDLTLDGDPETGYIVNVKVTNNTGHKLPSGYPEGRRIWISLIAYDVQGGIVYENGTYDFQNAEIKYGVNYPDMPTPKIYEIKPGIGPNIADVVNLPADVSFHFVLNNKIYKDNRIPPMGATIEELNAIQSPTVGYTYADGQYWDETYYSIPAGDISSVVARLYYQTMSKKYVTFLRDENTTNNAGNLLYNLWLDNGKSAPVVMVEKEIVIGGGNPPVTAFSASPLTGDAPLTVQFKDESTNSPDTWLWDFGDSNTSNQQSPEYTYQNQGIYTITLTASNAYGSNSLTKTDYISVSASPTIIMYASELNFTRQTAKGNREYANIEVTIRDEIGNGVEGANVIVEYSGPTSGTVSGFTDAGGIVIVRTTATKNLGINWCVDQIYAEKSGYTYNASGGIALPVCEFNQAARLANSEDNTIDEKIDGYVPFHNSPNPFNQETLIRFYIPVRSKVSLQVMDMQGKIIGVLLEEELAVGRHSYLWNVGELKEGQYILRLVTNNFVKSRKILKVN